MIRIIAGVKKGKKLKVLSGVTRPLTDMIKTSIFDLIADYIPDSSILDLFSGSGNFAIEAMSRGAKCSTLIELNPEAISLIKENLINTKFTVQTEVICENTFTFLKTKNTRKYYDIIFLDPPFPFTIEEKQELLNLSGKFMSPKNPNAIIIFRYPKQEIYRSKSNKEIYSKVYGISKVSFYRKKVV